MAGPADGITPDRVRTQAQEEGDRREDPLDAFIRRSGADKEQVSAARETQEDEFGFTEFKDERNELLDTGLDNTGGGGFTSKLGSVGGGLLAGNKFGFGTAKGIPFFNPLKAITNGFHQSQRHLAEPIAGQAIGWSTVGLGSLPGLRDTRVGEAKTKFLNEVVHGDGNFWSDSGDFQRERESLFWGEKFLSTIVADPLNLVGFGLLAKLPVVGRTALKGTANFGKLGGVQKMEFSLGGIETGYVAAVNLPFKKAGQIATKFPGTTLRMVGKVSGTDLRIPDKSRTQLVSDAGARADATIRGAFEEAAGGRAANTVLDEELAFFAGTAINRDISFNNLPTDAHRRFRSLVDEAPPLTKAEVQNYAKDIGGTEKITRQQRFQVSEMVDLAVSGRAHLEEVSGNIFTILGGKGASRQTLRKIEARIKTVQKKRHDAVDKTMSEATPQQLMTNARRTSMAIEKERINEHFTEWAMDNGKMGAFVAGLDKATTRIWTNGINKYLARPLATSILKTPEFLISNVMEDIARTLSGRASIVYQSVPETLTDTAGYRVLSRGIFESQSSQVGRIARNESQILGEEFGFTDVTKLVGIDLSTNPATKHAFEAAQLLSDKPFQLANQIASDARRGFLHDRGYKRLADQITHDPALVGLSEALDSLPAAIENSDFGRIVARTTWRAGRGDADKVRALKGELTADSITQKEAMKIIGQMGSEYTADVKHLFHTWAESGSNLGTLDDVVKQADRMNYKHLMASPERAAIQIEGLLMALKNVQPGSAEVPDMLRMIDDVVIGVLKIPATIERNTTRRMRRGEFGSAAKFDVGTRQLLHEQANAGQNLVYEVMDKKIGEIAREANRISGTNDNVWGKLHEQTFEFSRQTRQGRNDSLNALFNSTDDRSSYFWDTQVNDVLETAWVGGEVNAKALDKMREAAFESLGASRAGLAPPPEVALAPADLFTSGRRVGEHEISQILGGDAAQVSQAIIADAALGKTQFIDDILRKASDKGVTVHESARAKIGKVYDQVLGNLGIKENIHSMFSAREESLASLRDQLVMNKTANKFTPQLKQELDDYIERVAGSIEGLDDVARQGLVDGADASVGAALDDLKGSFVNYDDQNMLDSFMTAIFPFWTYESRRLPFLLRTGVQNPALWKTFGPQGVYDQQTDNGYVRKEQFGNAEVNLLGGTVFNAHRRIFRSEFPTQHDGGFLGDLSSAEESIARFGFYPGIHVKMLTDGILPAFDEGAEAETGNFIPQSYANLLNVIGTGSQLPGLNKALNPVADRLNGMREMIFGDRFRERQMMKELWDMGLPANEIDLETMQPREGSSITDEDIREALRRTSDKEFWTGMVGKVRFRSDDEVKLRDSITSIYEEAGLSREDQERARLAGKSRSELVALSPAMQETLNALPGADEYRAINSVLRSPKAKAMSEKTARMWADYDSQVEAVDDKQKDLDLDWQAGRVAPADYRKLSEELAARKRNVLPALRGRESRRDPVSGQLKDTPIAGFEKAAYFDVPMTPEEHQAFAMELGRDDFQPLAHPLEELLVQYRSFIPEDLNNDGVPEWNNFFKVREQFIEFAVDEELKAEFLELIAPELEFAPGIPNPRGILKQLSTTVLGDYWDIDNRIATELGVLKQVAARQRAQKIGDEADLFMFKANPIMKLYDKLVREEKERSRIADPMLDYSLNIFGFTGNQISFKNETAKAWWREDKGPNLSRLETVS